MKKLIEVTQVILIPHIAKTMLEIEESEIPALLERVGVENITEMKLSEIRNGGLDVEVDDPMSAYTIADIIDPNYDMDIEASTYMEWIGTYHLFIQDFGPVEEVSNDIVA